MPLSATGTEPYALEARGIGRRFGGFWAVEDVHVQVRRGERRAILGPNGAGKTTLFNVLTGDLPASTGTIRMDGRDVTMLPVHKRVALGLRRTYQHALLFDGLTVEDSLFLAVCGASGGWKSILPIRTDDERMARAHELAEIAGLYGELKRMVRHLSHGQRRQLEIGLALAESPRLLLLDEPAAGLSPAERPRLAELLLSLPADVAVVLIEHDMDIALQTSERVTVLHNGRLLAEGTPQEVMDDTAVHDVYVGGSHGH